MTSSVAQDVDRILCDPGQSKFAFQTGKNLIQACLYMPEPAPGNENDVDAESIIDFLEDVNQASLAETL
ncbi:MAG: hypothetical protein Q9175_003126 [Cornicularia normoerica]